MDFNGIETEYPRILVISNNSFSDITNNGKTFASFFDKYPVNNIAQLYFCLELPSYTHYHNYFRITDNDIVKCVLKRKGNCGNIVYQQVGLKDKNSQKKYKSLFKIVKKYNFARIIREILWSSKKWKTELLNQWLNEFSPEIIFLCAGDSGFAYDITRYVQKKYNTKLVVYIGDDYVLPRKFVSPFWWLRRNYILNKVRDAINRSDLFITISKQMKEEYKKLFGKDSILAVNMTKSMRDKSIYVKSKNVLTLVYTGGLHYRRYITLNLLAQSLKKYNNDLKNKKKAYLKIYSAQEPSWKELKYLNIEGVSEFCGKLNFKQLKQVLNSCDIPVHAESFDKKSIESTRFSISTKIPEYLSLGKAILAIGPYQVASMEYLKDSAFCITNQNNIYSDLLKLLNNNELREALSEKALLKYEENHKKEIVSKQFISNILSVYKNRS